MAGRIRSEDIAAVRERARIEEVVGAHVTLKPAGVGSMKGLCPFHDERTPSFHVRPQLGLWHCFGCGEGGDVISFVQKIDHLAFAEAVEHLAGRFGVQLRYEEGSGPRQPGMETGRRQRLLEAHRVAAQYYAEQMESPEAQPGRTFLADRDFDRAAAARFGVGYAPKGWESLTRHLTGRGFTQAELTTAGLAAQGNRGVYDRFRGRLVWPIRDTTGDVIGFGARRLYEEDQGPKYLNTPETPLYRKNQVLYGIDLAKKDIAQRKQVVVVEGYTDVMAMHLSGVPTAIATCGTAFGPDHARVVGRLLGDSGGASGVMLASGSAVGGEVVFTFDGDEAGRKAALRAFNEDQRFAAQTFVAVESTGLDPSDLREQRGEAAVRALVAEREPLFEFAIKSALRQVDLGTAEGRVAGLRAAAPVVARLRDHALRGEYARELAGWLGMDEVSVRQAVQRVGRSEQGGGEQRGDRSRERGGPSASEQQQRPSLASTPSDDPVVRLEREVLVAVLQLPQHALDAGFDSLGADTFAVPAHRAVHDAIRAAGGVTAYREIAASLVPGGSEPRAAAQWADSVRESAGPIGGMVTELAVAPLPEDRPEAVGGWARGVLTALMRLGLNRQIGELKARLQRTEPHDPGYQGTFAELIALEEQRRALQRD